MNINERLEKALAKLESMSEEDFRKDLLKFSYVNTETLQLQSLFNFASCIGYLWTGDGSFRWSMVGSTSRKIVSFNTMVWYHNWELRSYKFYCNMPDFAVRTNLTEVMRDKACESKLVSRVKLQWSKKENKVIVQSHKICLRKEIV
jgi:hypothetical protein